MAPQQPRQQSNMLRVSLPTVAISLALGYLLLRR
jgi:hypothetical protein